MAYVPQDDQAVLAAMREIINEYFIGLPGGKE